MEKTTKKFTLDSYNGRLVTTLIIVAFVIIGIFALSYDEYYDEHYEYMGNEYNQFTGSSNSKQTVPMDYLFCNSCQTIIPSSSQTAGANVMCPVCGLKMNHIRNGSQNMQNATGKNRGANQGNNAMLINGNMGQMAGGNKTMQQINRDRNRMMAQLNNQVVNSPNIRQMVQNQNGMMNQNMNQGQMGMNQNMMNPARRENELNNLMMNQPGMNPNGMVNQNMMQQPMMGRQVAGVGGTLMQNGVITQPNNNPMIPTAFTGGNMRAAMMQVALPVAPPITINSTMPHPFRGVCGKCHIVVDKTRRPIAPPINVNSAMPHPFRGVCQKCHLVSGAN